MRNLVVIMAFAALVASGCGKKSEPEEVTSDAVKTTLVELTLVREDSQNSVEAANLLGVLSVHNGLSGTITIDRVEYTGYVGGHETEKMSTNLGAKLASGEAINIKLLTKYYWKDDADIAAKKGRFKGALYYTGPKGHSHSVPFDHQSSLEIKGQ